MNDGGHGRRELAKFLRSRRQRITPADVGLPAGPRRRTDGLRREEVAVLAGLSPTWYTYLEQSRDIHPSAAVLDSLSRVLHLTEHERRYMYLLAHGQAPQTASDSPDRDTAHDLVRCLVAATDDSDYPVYAFDPTGTILARNPACTVWYTDFTDSSNGYHNIIWWMFTSSRARECFVTWEHDARDMVAQFRAYHASHLVIAERGRLISELEQRSPEFQRWWHEHDVHSQHGRIRVLRHPERGPVRLQVAVLHPADAPSVSVAFHLPESTTNTP